MRFGMFFQLLELVLQFNDRLLKVELMFHPRKRTRFGARGNSNVSERKNVRAVQSKSRTCIRLLVMTRFIRLHPGAQKGDAANYLLAVRTASQAKPLY